MLYPIHIFALSQPGFVRQQVRSVFCGRGQGQVTQRRESCWRGWGLLKP